MICSLSILDGVTSYSYKEYADLAIHLAEIGGTTGELSISHIEATKINAQRIKRLNKQITINPDLLEEINSLNRDLIWVVITEAWCGDGAQCIPVIAAIAEKTDKITLQIIMRDDNPAIMDRYLTNNARSIPKLIAFDAHSGSELGVWGSRPEKIQEMVVEFKTKHPQANKDEFHENLHLWYAKDRTQAIQIDFLRLLREWK